MLEKRFLKKAKSHILQSGKITGKFRFDKGKRDGNKENRL